MKSIGFYKVSFEIQILWNDGFTFLAHVFALPVCIDPVYEDVLSDSRKMITNEQINLYNEAAVSTLNTSKKKVKFLEASRQAAMETISQSEDGLHLPESTIDVVRLWLRLVLQLIILFYSFYFYD